MRVCNILDAPIQYIQNLPGVCKYICVITGVQFLTKHIFKSNFKSFREKLIENCGGKIQKYKYKIIFLTKYF